MRIGIVDAVSPATKVGSTSRFLGAIRQLMARTSFDFIITGTERSDGSPYSTEMAIDRLLGADDPPDILLGFLPDGASSADEDGDAQYNTFKSITVGRGIPSQVIHRTTLENYNTYTLNNIAIGIIGKTGNIPFILADKLPYADIVTGIDIARRKKDTLQGSMSIAAAARIYLNTGELLRYSIRDVPIEGETLPANVLYRLFPASEFENKRVVIHRDGPFMQGEKATLRRWADQLGASFYFVEVIKTSAPRVYGIDENNQIQQPPEWTAFTTSSTEAFLVSYAPKPDSYDSYGTPRPLHIRTEHPFSIHDALHSVLSMTLLHYGSIKHPRLPVTVHYADKLGEMLLRGIRPSNTEGSVPFWL
jgi:argonaute-like protein implicated in RNA metabolism and viral defense